MSDSRMQSDPTGRLLPLLQEMLSRARLSRHTPLQFGIDSDGIVRAALRDHHPTLAAGRPADPQDWATVQALLTQLIERLLLAPRPGQQVDHISRRRMLPGADTESACAAVEPIRERAPHPLAAWLDRFHSILREVHPQAIDIVDLRAAGFQDRYIAQRLGLSLRLVRRIADDVRVAHGSATKTE